MRGGIHAVLLVCCLWPLAALAELPEGLAGRWSGTVVVNDRARPIEVVVAQRGDGFAVDLILPDILPLRAELVATDEPQVYEMAAASGGLFGFFDGGRQRDADPLSGSPLVWARTTSMGMVAYRLAIAPEGDMGLLRVALDVVEEGLELRVERRINVRAPERFEALLTRGE
jgi:hypothetical protein